MSYYKFVAITIDDKHDTRETDPRPNNNSQMQLIIGLQVTKTTLTVDQLIIIQLIIIDPNSNNYKKICCWTMNVHPAEKDLFRETQKLDVLGI